MSVTYYAINEDTARTAHNMVHMSDYKPGSCTAGYRAAVDEAAALVEVQKSKISPFYHERLDGLLDAYARRLAAWHNDYNRNQASYPSQFICGAGGFNMRKHNKQMAREGTLWQEYDEIRQLLRKIESVGSGPVDLADPHAREMLADQLHRLQKQLDNGKAMNAWYRKHKTLKGFPDMSDEDAARNDAAIASAPSFAQTPYPDFELASLRGKIKRLQARIAELDKLQAAAEQPAETTKFDGGEIIHNAEQNRLQILFDDIPDEETRAQLKSHGFRWSPKNKVWQRQLTRNAEYDARQILGIA